MTDPVTMRRKLRLELKRLRLEHDFTQRYVAETLDWSQSKVIRIENGTVPVAVTDLQALLRLYRVEDEAVAAELTAMARGSKRLPFTEYKNVISAEALRFFAYESSAGIIRQLEPLLVPGLLQTEEYARALLRSWDIGEQETSLHWEARAERQEVLDRPDPPEMFFIIDEAVIRRVVGSEGIMRRQRARLLELSRHPRVTIQVLPFESGAHAGMRGPFVYLEFPTSDDLDILYLEGPLGDSVFRDDEEVTGKYLETFFALERTASAPGDLEKVMSALPH